MHSNRFGILTSQLFLQESDFRQFCNQHRPWDEIKLERVCWRNRWGRLDRRAGKLTYENGILESRGSALMKIQYLVGVAEKPRNSFSWFHEKSLEKHLLKQSMDLLENNNDKIIGKIYSSRGWFSSFSYPASNWWEKEREKKMENREKQNSKEKKYFLWKKGIYYIQT